MNDNPAESLARTFVDEPDRAEFTRLLDAALAAERRAGADDERRRLTVALVKTRRLENESHGNYAKRVAERAFLDAEAER